MQTIPSFYEVGSCSESYNNFLQGIMGSSEMMMNSLEDTSCVSPRSLAEAKAIAANKSHSEAERRRRKRINGHLATLRTLLPNTIKTDKASLLAEAVKCVRELKKTTTELAAAPESDTDDDSSFSYATAGGGGEVRRTKYMFPSETDELKLSYAAGEEGGGNLKAALCCEDRPEIITEVVRALKTVEGKVVRAEMATVGGRIKCVLWVHVEGLNNGGGGDGGEEVVAAVRRALKVVVDRSNAVVNSNQSDLTGHKRPRLYQY